MNFGRSNSLSLKYQGFPPLGCQDIRIRKFEFVAKTQFLCSQISSNSSNVVYSIKIAGNLQRMFVNNETLQKKITDYD